MPVVNANNVHPDQMLGYAASDLGLHCLPMSHLWDTRHKLVKCISHVLLHVFVRCLPEIPTRA